jgi:hypothetical protein
MSPTYNDTIRSAANLFPDWDAWHMNPEYLRGMSELIADTFPIAGEDMESRVETVVADIKAYLVAQA